MTSVCTSCAAPTGELGFEILAGGGLGRTPIIGQVVREFLPREHLLSYLEAVLRIYNREGRRDNLTKARIKILVNALGIEEFRRRVEAEWESIKDGGLRVAEEEVARMRGFFDPPAYRELRDSEPAAGKETAFRAWYRYNTAEHKVPGYRVVYVSLKKADSPPGDATDAQMELIADLADRYSFGEMRVTHTQNLLLADVEQAKHLRTVAGARRGRTRDAEHRHPHRHDLLPGARFLQSCQRRFHRRGEAHQRTVR